MLPLKHHSGFVEDEEEKNKTLLLFFLLSEKRIARRITLGLEIAKPEVFLFVKKILKV